MPVHDRSVSFVHWKVAGGTEADLSVTAKQTQLYVCRVNDMLGKYVFSDWVKVKVLDIDKTGMLCYLVMRHVNYHQIVCLFQSFCIASHTHLYFRLSFIIRFASRLAGWTTHRRQPKTPNNQKRWQTHLALCSLWYPCSALSVVQKWTAAAHRVCWRTTGKWHGIKSILFVSSV